jgi:outer membrane protein TolC
MKRLLISAMTAAILAMTTICAGAQQNDTPNKVLTLEECRNLARESIEASRNATLVQEGAKIRESILKRIILPQVAAVGLTSYQTHTPDMGALVNHQIDFKQLSKWQYGGFLLFGQTIYDGGEYRTKRLLTNLTKEEELLDIEQKALQTENIADELYFNALLAEKSLEILNIAHNRLQNDLKSIESLFSEGVIYRKDVMLIEMQLLESSHRISGLEIEREKCLSLLSTLTGSEITPETRLEMPSRYIIETITEDPALRQIDIRSEQIDAGRRLSLSKVLPRVELYALGHYGKWGMDVFSDDPLLSGLAGVAIIIPISDWRTHYRNKALSINEKNRLEISRANLELQTELKRTEIEKEIAACEKLEIQAAEMASKYRELADELRLMMQKGEISENEYLTALNMQTQAELGKEYHRIEKIRKIILSHRIFIDNPDN